MRDVLALPVVRRTEPELLTDDSGLDNEIRWVHAGEAPNIASLLKGGELLLSTGMGVGGSARAQRRFVAQLAEIGIAALAIELGTTLTEMPTALISAAESEDLCLIAFHREVRFVEITEAVHREVIDQGGELRRRGDELHRRFTALMLTGAHAPDILVELAAFVRNPVFLERSGQGIAYHACHEADDETALRAWGSYSRGITTAPEAVSERVPMGRDGSWGRLVALAVDSPLEPAGRVAIERAVGLIALALMREQEDQVLATRRRGDFLASLPNSHAGEAEVAARAAELGFDRRGEALLPVAMASPTGATGPAWVTLRRDIVDELERQAVPVIAGDGERGEALLVLGLSRVSDRSRIADQLAEAAGRATAWRLGEDIPTICVGAAVTRWHEAGAGLGVAVDALPASASMAPRPWHDVSVASIGRLLFAFRERPELRRFVELRLHPLIEADHSGRGDLVDTLAAYCAHGARKTETARALHVERQTLYHRLRKIEEILGADLTDSETILSFHLALHARHYLDLD